MGREVQPLPREFLLVDGYNIIHAWDELRELVEDVSLESARQRLMDILSNYKGVQKATIILVFDGYLVKGMLHLLHLTLKLPRRHADCALPVNDQLFQPIPCGYAHPVMLRQRRHHTLYVMVSRFRLFWEALRRRK